VPQALPGKALARLSPMQCRYPTASNEVFIANASAIRKYCQPECSSPGSTIRKRLAEITVDHHPTKQLTADGRKYPLRHDHHHAPVGRGKCYKSTYWGTGGYEAVTGKFLFKHRSGVNGIIFMEYRPNPRSAALLEPLRGTHCLPKGTSRVVLGRSLTTKDGQASSLREAKKDEPKRRNRSGRAR